MQSRSGNPVAKLSSLRRFISLCFLETDFTSKKSAQNDLIIPKRLIFLLGIIYISELLIINLTDRFVVKDQYALQIPTQAIAIATLLLGFFLYYLNLAGIKFNSPAGRHLILFCSSLCFTATNMFNQYSFLKKAIEINSIEGWFYCTSNLITIISSTLLTDFLFNSVVLKALPHIGCIVSLVAGHNLLISRNFLMFHWIIIVVSSTPIIFILTAKVYMNRIVSKRGSQATESTTDFLPFIVQSLPSAIIVIDRDKKELYSNKEYMKLTAKYGDSLIEKINLSRSNQSESQGVRTSYMLGAKTSQLESNLILTKHYDDDDDDICLDPTVQEIGGTSNRIVRSENSLFEVIDNIKKIQSINDIEIQVIGTLLSSKEDSKQDERHYAIFDIKICRCAENGNIVIILDDHTRYGHDAGNHEDYKDKLLAMVSHEMRTPLNGNLALIEAAIAHNNMNPLIKEKLLQPAIQSGKLLLHFVNDILDMAQIRAKKLRLAFERLQLKTTLSNCYQLIELKASTKGVNLIMDIDTRIPQLFNTDHNRLSQIILNLLSNALKFTFVGEIRLQVKLLDPHILEFIITDTGIGMSKEDIKKLFGRFTQISYGRRKNVNKEGCGLGLSIANMLVKTLGPAGNKGILVESVIDKGSEFKFYIQEQKSDEEDTIDKVLEIRSIANDSFKEVLKGGFKYDSMWTPKTQRRSLDIINNPSELNEQSDVSRPYESPTPKIMSRVLSEGLRRRCNLIDSRFRDLLRNASIDFEKKQSVKNRKILIVDDEPFNILAIKSILDILGIKAESAHNGKEAIDKVMRKLQEKDEKKYYSMIIMDCQMPVMDGYQATKALLHIYEKEKIPSAPIIGCSGFISEEHLDRCISNGMKEVLQKPISKEKLEDVINRLIINK